MATDLRTALEHALQNLKNETVSLRTGRATPALVEDLMVEAYGSLQALKTVAAISVPEPRQLLVQPWDKTMLPAIERAIQSSPLGLAPIADRDAIRLALPVLTSERKQQLIRLLGEKLEAVRIQVRQHRDEAMKAIETRAKAKELSEDEKHRERQGVEKIVGEINARIESMGTQKEQEITTG